MLLSLSYLKVLINCSVSFILCNLFLCEKHLRWGVGLLKGDPSLFIEGYTQNYVLFCFLMCILFFTYLYVKTTMELF